MTEDARVAAYLSQIDEILKDRLPEHMPEKRPDWQMWIAIATILFYGGITWLQIQDNSKAITSMITIHKEDKSKLVDGIDDLESNLIMHINAENERALVIEREIVIELKRKLGVIGGG